MKNLRRVMPTPVLHRRMFDHNLDHLSLNERLSEVEQFKSFDQVYSRLFILRLIMTETSAQSQMLCSTKMLPKFEPSWVTIKLTKIIHFLQGTAQLNSYVTLVNLPTPNVDVAVGTECTVYGWGTTSSGGKVSPS